MSQTGDTPDSNIIISDGLLRMHAESLSAVLEEADVLDYPVMNSVDFVNDLMYIGIPGVSDGVFEVMYHRRNVRVVIHVDIKDVKTDGITISMTPYVSLVEASVATLHPRLPNRFDYDALTEKLCKSVGL